MTKYLLRTSLIALCSTWLPTPAVAQMAGAAPAAPAVERESERASEGLEDIVVTAQRREERLQEVPISVSVVGATNLAAQGVTSASPTALSVAVPALTGNFVVGRPTYFLRGVGSNNGALVNEPTVPLYLDGVYLGASQTNATEFNNIERIEVLKGPQGTLFGRNATGGIIQIITKTPSLTKSTVSAEAGIASYKTVNFGLYGSVPISETLAVNLAVNYKQQFDGWGFNKNIKKDIYKGWSSGARGKILFQPTEKTTFILAGDYTDYKDSFNQQRHPNGVPDNQGFVMPQTGGYDSFASFVPETSGRGGGVSLHITHDFGSMILESISALRHNRSYLNLDADGRPDNYFNTGQLSFQNLTTQEVHLLNSPGSAIDWILGGFYIRRRTWDSAKSPGITYGAITGANLYNKADAEQIVESYSPFAQATVEVIDRLKLTAGLRWTKEKANANQTSYSALGSVVFVPQKTSLEKLTWRLAADYHFSDDVHAYVSYNRGIKSGGFNLAALAQFPPYRAEVLDAYEVGIKSSLLDNRLRINIAVYHYDYKDIQIRAYPMVGVSTTYNAGAARIQGIDFDLEAALSRDLTVTAAFTALESKLTKFTGQASTTGPSGGATIFFNPIGNRLPFAAPFSGSITAKYETDTNVGRLTASASYSYTSSYYPDLDDRASSTKFEPRSIVNASLGWQSLDKDFGIEVWGRNLTKEYYYATLTKIFSGDLIVPAAPRTFGITARYNY